MCDCNPRPTELTTSVKWVLIVSALQVSSSPDKTNWHQNSLAGKTNHRALAGPSKATHLLSKIKEKKEKECSFFRVFLHSSEIEISLIHLSSYHQDHRIFLPCVLVLPKGPLQVLASTNHMIL